MKYLTLDTCVWLNLLKIDLNTSVNVFEEICFWIEDGHLIHIVPQNIIREWDRHKLQTIPQIVREMENEQRYALQQLSVNELPDSVHEPNQLAKVIQQRAERIDQILRTKSELAPEDDKILIKAANRCLECLPPNHSKDSYRDTVILLSLTEHIASKGYKDCFFSTINYKDFGESKERKHILHKGLEELFSPSGLRYAYFDIESRASALFKGKLSSLPSLHEHLKNMRASTEDQELQSRKAATISTVQSTDQEFLANISYIDLIMGKEERTAFENEMLTALLNRHPSYKQYFLKNVGTDGLV